MYFLWNYLFVMVLITEDMVVEGMWLVDVGLPLEPRNPKESPATSFFLMCVAFVSVHGGFLKWGYPKMDGLFWKITLNGR